LNYTTALRAPRPSSLLFFTHPPPTPLYPLSLHDALPISPRPRRALFLTAACCSGSPSADRSSWSCGRTGPTSSRCSGPGTPQDRSEEHTSELQSRFDLVCRLLLEKKK